MAVIQVTPELLEAKAKEVRNLRSQHDDVMARIGSLVHSLNDQWKGEAQTAFVDKFDSMQPTFTSFSEMINNYAALLDDSARIMAETDQALKNQINNSGV